VGHFYTVFLKGDSTAAAYGKKEKGNCNIQALGEGVTYTQVAIGHSHTFLLKRDGAAAACGLNYDGATSQS
jgi:hypothetical protein